jgi:hypothetical protein
MVVQSVCVHDNLSEACMQPAAPPMHFSSFVNAILAIRLYSLWDLYSGGE